MFFLRSIGEYETQYDRYHAYGLQVAVSAGSSEYSMLSEMFFLVVRNSAEDGYGDYGIVLLLSSLIYSGILEYAGIELAFGDSGCNVMSTVAIGFKD